MRPSFAGEIPALGAPRCKPESIRQLPGGGHGVPTSFFLATEEMLESGHAHTDGPSAVSGFGVQSLHDTMHGTWEHAESDLAEHDGFHHGVTDSTLRKLPTIQKNSSSVVEQTPFASIGSSSFGQSLPPSAPLSIMSSSQASLAPGSSLPSSPKSVSTRFYGHSDEDSMSDERSQVITSSEDEETYPSVQESDPQLIMPSLRMPSRRRFTERGKGIGRLKVLVAGDSGVGKTSLIKAMVQTCEDVVHVDPIASTLTALPPQRPKTKNDKTSYNTTKQITEISASTKPYPSWWSEIEESKVLRRRKSMGETVLDRNLCFVDTPGFSQGMSIMESIESVVRYVEAQMSRTYSMDNMSDSEVLSTLSGNGGLQVDLVLYMIMQRPKPADLELLRRLTSLTNVVPLIAKADLMSSEDQDTLKTAILEDLRKADIRHFTFVPNNSPQPPYTVCSAPSNDEENMDASLLMSSEYVQPLLPSELTTLLDQIFEKDNLSWLRHSAAMKLVQYRRRSETPLLLTSPSNIALPSQDTHAIVHATRPSAYTRARILDHTQHEERIAQIRLAKWAGDLQRSLQNERMRYEALASDERVIWLNQKLDDNSNEENLSPNASKSLVSLRTSTPGTASRAGLIDTHDPLGILRWNEMMKSKGWVAVQLVGGFGILGAVGALAFWAVRNWGSSVDGSGNWNRGWWSWHV